MTLRAPNWVMIGLQNPKKIMILTKENVASQAFAEHIIGLSLPSWKSGPLSKSGQHNVLAVSREDLAAALLLLQSLPILPKEGSPPSPVLQKGPQRRRLPPLSEGGAAAIPQHPGLALPAKKTSPLLLVG